MENIRAFLKRKDVIISAHRYGIDAMGAMAQGLFASLLIGQSVVLALGLLKLRLGVVHTAGRAGGSLLVGLLGLVQRLSQLLIAAVQSPETTGKPPLFPEQAVQHFSYSSTIRPFSSAQAMKPRAGGRSPFL